ncbi:MAG: hypothetical protein Q9180_001049 [Flavoplaca navasiana]
MPRHRRRRQYGVGQGPPEASIGSGNPILQFRPEYRLQWNMNRVANSLESRNNSSLSYASSEARDDSNYSDLNALVMDYLISEGYPSAAQKFASEANIQPTSAVDSIQERVAIREAIYRGDIQSAIERINELNPMRYKLLEKDETLHFALLRLQLVELIRSCGTTSPDDPTPAINFATTELAPRAPTNPQFLEDLERTMTLLIFERKDLPPQIATLLEPKLRKDVAQRVNEALLKEQGERTKAKLFNLVHLRAWSEQKAREAKKDLPEHMGFGLDLMQNGHGKNNHDGMQSNGEAEAMVA